MLTYPQEARGRGRIHAAVGIKACPELRGLFVENVAIHHPTEQRFERVAIQASYLQQPP